MTFLKELILLFVFLNISLVLGNTGRFRLRPMSRSIFNGFLRRQNNLRFNSMLRLARNNRQGLTQNRRNIPLTPFLSNRNSRLRPLRSSTRPINSVDSDMMLARETVARRLRHPLTCAKGKVLVCGESRRGITIQKCYSNCGRKSCIVPCVCICFQKPKRGLLRPLGQSIFLPLAERPRIPFCYRDEVLRCTAKRMSMATNSLCSSACMRGFCPATCNCRCMDEKLVGRGLDADIGSKKIISDTSQGLGTAANSGTKVVSVKDGGKVIGKSGSVSSVSGSGTTETETIDVKIDVVKGDNKGDKGRTGKGNNVPGNGIDVGTGINGILDPGLLNNLAASSGGTNGLNNVGPTGGLQQTDFGLGAPLQNDVSLGGNDPLVVLDPTQKGKPVGNIAVNPSNPLATAGLLPDPSIANLNTVLDNINPLGNSPSGDFARMMENLGGSVDLLDPSLANVLPMALGQLEANQGSAGLLGSSNTAGTKIGGLNDIASSNIGGLKDLGGLNGGGTNSINGLSVGNNGLLDTAGIPSGGPNNAAGLDTGILNNKKGLGDALSTGLGGANGVLATGLGGANDAIAAGVGGANDALATGLGGANDALASGVGGASKSVGGLIQAWGSGSDGQNSNAFNNGNSNSGALSQGLNELLGSSTSNKNNAALNKGNFNADGLNQGVNDLFVSAMANNDPLNKGNLNALNRGINDILGSSSANLNNDPLNKGNLNALKQGINEFLGTGSASINNGRAGNGITGTAALNSVGTEVSRIPPSITGNQNNDYCSKTGRKMWCNAGITWENTPGLTRWCNVNCLSGACDVERCTCNCVTSQEYELNFSKFMGFK